MNITYQNLYTVIFFFIKKKEEMFLGVCYYFTAEPIIEITTHDIISCKFLVNQQCIV